jgi:uncharacterized phage-associated protein
MSSNSENIDISNYKPKSKTKLSPDELGGETDDLNVNDELSNKEWRHTQEFQFDYTPENQTSVFDVVAYILEKMGELTTMKLHKLIYYAQAWSLVWDEKPLFNEPIEAWANGPVVRSLFSYHQGYYSLSKLDLNIGNPDVLNLDQKETIDSIIEYYGNKPAQWLVELSHLENPWKKARKGLGPLERGNKVISLESMAEYYSSL